jgi:hypothetical protein
MTTIAYRNGVLAADSRCTYEDPSAGTQVFKCEKLFRKSIPNAEGQMEEVILATQGETFSGMLFVDWYGSGKEPPELLIHGDAEFTVLILKKDGLYEVDRWCRPIKVLEDFYAVGSGSKAAMGAMFMGADAAKAVDVACKIDPYSALPIVTMSLTKPAAKRVRKPRVGKPKNTGQLQLHELPLAMIKGQL